MKPSIERELQAIRQMLIDLENRLRGESVELGHRQVFAVGRRGEVPAPTEADRGRVLVAGHGWQTLTGSGGGGGSGTPDGHTLSSVTGVLNAEPLSGTVDARFKDLSGSLSGRFNTVTGATVDGGTLSSVTGVLNALPLSGTIDARFINLSGTVDGHFNALSGTVDAAFKNLSAVSLFSAGTQAFSYTAAGTEGSRATVTLPTPISGTTYRVWVVNTSGSTISSYQIPEASKTTASFALQSTAPFTAGDKFDFFVLSGSGLGSGSVVSRTQMWDPPTEAHPWDYEFDTRGVIDSPWVITGSAGAANIPLNFNLLYGINPYVGWATGTVRYEVSENRRSWLMIQPPASASNITVLYRPVADVPTNMFFYARLSMTTRLATSPANNDSSAALCLFDSGSAADAPNIFKNAVQLFFNESDAGTVQIEFVKNESAVGTSLVVGEDAWVTRATPQPYEIVALQKLGTVYHGWVFDAMGTGAYCGSLTWTGSLNAVGVMFENATSTSPGNMVMGLDFVRFVSSSLYFP